MCQKYFIWKFVSTKAEWDSCNPTYDKWFRNIWMDALEFSYILICRVNTWSKIYTRKSWFKKNNNFWTIWFSPYHILCIGVGISPKQLFNGCIFPPDRVRELNNFSLFTDFACTLWVSVRFDKIRPLGAKISEKE